MKPREAWTGVDTIGICGTQYTVQNIRYVTRGTQPKVVFPPGEGVRLRLRSVCVRFNTERPKNVSGKKGFG